MIENAIELNVNGEKGSIESPFFVDVALPLPIRSTFTYCLNRPHPFSRRGVRLLVPFRKKQLIGIALRFHNETPEFETKPVFEIIDQEPFVDEAFLSFLEEAANYYLHPIGEVLKAAIPAPFWDPRRAKGQIRTRDDSLWIERSELPLPPRLGSRQRDVIALLESQGALPLKEVLALTAASAQTIRQLERRGLIRKKAPPSAPLRATEQALELSLEQRQVLLSIASVIEQSKPSTFLLHGVTGSGKTEVYLQAIQKAIALGKSAIVLVPEIALTSQLLRRFRSRFGDEVAVLHSGMRESERFREWERIRRGQAKIALGARSAIFAPVQKLGIIVIDEEHDPSYKQEEGFRYHARDMGILRAIRSGGVALLGSATPSLESFYHAKQG
ncbi:MAG: DEAD/DEAH box helicase family protein, partial [Deltaproteobacteria bacterium]|nr:DEAD/DEAH box helicase family protein [Deltaproteobacteria bacterium]